MGKVLGRIVDGRDGGHVPRIGDVVPFVGESGVDADALRDHAVDGEPLKEDAAYEDGGLHARTVVLESVQRRVSSAVEQTVLAPQAGPSFEFGWGETANSTCYRGVDES